MVKNVQALVLEMGGLEEVEADPAKLQQLAAALTADPAVVADEVR
jgi:hypothetical protein